MVSPGGKYQAVDSSVHGGSGKRGRNVHIDQMMSQRGGEANFAPRRMGTLDSDRVGGWYTPSSHNTNCHDPMAVRMDAAGSLRSETGYTNLGGGKKGRNPARETMMSHGGAELWKSPQSKPQMKTWGTMTGGGAKGRSPQKDRQQSSNLDGGLW